MLSLFQKRKQTAVLNGGSSMKGFTIESGYMGYVGGSYVLFASEQDYQEYLED